MNTDIKLVKVESQPMAAIRKVTTMTDLPKVIPSTLDEVYKFLKSNQKINPGYNVAVYIDEKLTVDIGVIVSEKFENKDPSGTAVHSTHIGSYRELSQTHSLIRKWCKDYNVETTFPSWEVYGHGNEDESKLKTDVYYLLKENI